MRGLTEEAAAVAIDVATRVLHLPTVRASADELAAAAVRDRVTHRAYLAELLAAEVDDREARRRERRIAEARFPRIKRLAEFDLGATPSIAPGRPRGPRDRRLDQRGRAGRPARATAGPARRTS